MSSNLIPLRVAKVIDPRLDFSQRKEYVALRGGLVNSWQSFPAPVSNSSISLTCNPPNAGISTTRIVYKRVQFDIVVTGTNTSGSTLLQPGYGAPRAAPITAATTTEEMRIGNGTVTESQTNTIRLPLQWFHNEHNQRFGQDSLYPAMLDQFQDYSAGAGSIRNPLATYENNSFENTRGGFVGYVVAPQAPNNTVANISLICTEPLRVSPFQDGKLSNEGLGIIGVQTMSYTTNFGDLSRVLSLVQNQGQPGFINITNVAVNVSRFELLFNYITPDPIEPVPRNLSYSYFSITALNVVNFPSIAPGGSATLDLQSNQLTGVPKRIYLFARRSDATQTAFTSDAYLSVDVVGNPLKIRFNNNEYMAGATAQDLYNMSVKNGLDMSYTQFSDKCGSLIAIDFSTDICLPSNISSGSMGSYDFSARLNVRNTSSASVQPVFYGLVVYEGVLQIIDGSVSTSLSSLTSADVLGAVEVPGITYKRSQNIYGGDFFRKLKNIAMKAHAFAKEKKLISKGLAMIPHSNAAAASKVAQSLGYGLVGGRTRRMRGRGLNASDLCEDAEDAEDSD